MNYTRRTNWLLTALPLKKNMLQTQTYLWNMQKTKNIIYFQRVISGRAIDDDMFDVVIRLTVYRSQATGYMGGAVVCCCDDGNFHCCNSLNRNGAMAL